MNLPWRFAPALSRLLACLTYAVLACQIFGAIGPDPTFRPRFEIPGAVTELALQADGKVLVGGAFDRVGETPAAGLVRLTAEGRLDPDFVPAIGGTVTAIALQPADRKILVAGDFPGGNTSLVRLNPDGSLDPSFLTNVWAEYRINALVAYPDGRILVGGQFGYLQTEAGTVWTRGIARLLANGEPDADFYPSAGYGPDNSESVDTLALLPDGTIYVGGQFETFNQFGRPNLVRLRPDGSLDRDFETYDGPNWRVRQVVPRDDGGLWVAGEFGWINRIPRPGVALLAEDGSLDSRFRPALTAVAGFSALLPLSGGDLLVARQVYSQTANNPRKLLTRLSPGGQVVADLDPAFMSGGFTPSVDALLATPGGTVLFGGHFATPGEQPRSGLGELQADGNLSARMTIAFHAPGGVRELEVQNDGKILVAGSFLSVNGVPRPTLARLGPDGATDLSFQPAVTGSVWAMTLQADQKLLIGGILVRPGKEETGAVARLNPDGSIDFFFETGSLVRALRSDSKGRILVGLESRGLGGEILSAIGRLLADGSVDGSFSPKPGGYGSVFAIAEQADGKLVLGGNFRDAASGDYLTRLEEDGREDPTFRPALALDSIVTSLAVDSENRILVGGWFRQWRGADQSGLGRLLPDGSPDTGFKPALGRFSEGDRILVRANGSILTAGRIYPTIERPWSGVMQLNSDGTEDTGFIVIGRRDAAAIGSDLAIEPDGGVLFARGFYGAVPGETTLVRLVSLPPANLGLSAPTFAADGKIRFQVALPDRNPRQVRLESSDDLRNWSLFHSLESSGELEALATAPAPDSNRRFFRAVISE